jgi:phosphate:Na+ symporter
LTIGNLLTRVVGCIVGLALLDRIGRFMVTVEPDPVRAVADFHTGFNLVLAIVFLPGLAPYAALLRRLLPARLAADDPSRPRYLDPTAMEAPPIAIAAAAREALRMTDALEAMLTGAADTLGSTDRRRIADVRRLDDVLDRLNSAIKAYLTAMDPDTLSEADHRRLTEILVFTTNLEAAGDVIDRDLMGLAVKRLKRGLVLSGPEHAEVVRLLQHLISTVRAAAAVFMQQDGRAARLLVAEKEAFRGLESDATAAYFASMRHSDSGGAASALHLDLLRDLKRVNSHLVAAAAYPVLEEEGVLLPTRLRADP